VTEFLVDVHPWTGYIVSVVLLITAMVAFKRAKDAREFTNGPYSLAMVLLDIQVLLGLVLYALDGYWDARPEIAYLHPVLALLALGIGHALLGRAKKTQMAVDAHRTAGRGLVLALVFTLLAVGVASAPAFL
jgi:heme A synthase